MIYIIVGTRPNYIKAFPVYIELKTRKIPVKLVHTNQHYDRNVKDIFFEELGIQVVTFLLFRTQRVNLI